MPTKCSFCWRILSDANERHYYGFPAYGILELIYTYDLVKKKPVPKKK